MSDPFYTRSFWRERLFAIFGALSRRTRDRGETIPQEVRRILVLLPVLRGDYLTLTPLLAGLKKVRPGAELGVVVTRPSLDVARVDPVVDRVFLYEKLPAWPRSMCDIMRFQPDVVVVPKGHPAFTESLLVVTSRANWRVGLSHPHHDALLTHPIPHAGENIHRAEACARLLEPFGIKPEEVDRRTYIGLDTGAEKKAKEFFRGADNSVFRVAINVSAGSARRTWPGVKWIELLSRLGENEKSISFLLLGSPGDHALCRRIAEQVDTAKTVSTSTFLEANALIARSHLLISPDTGAVHGAAARGVPLLVLYNGDRVVHVRFRPLHVPLETVFAEEGKNVSDISVDPVFIKAMAMIRKLRS